MPGTSAPSPMPAYVAHLTPLPLDSEPMRQVRLSARQHTALDGLTVPVVIDPHSPLLPCDQAELAIADAVNAALGRHTIAVLWRRGRDLGDVSVLLGDRLVPVASVELVPAREQVAAA